MKKNSLKKKKFTSSAELEKYIDLCKASDWLLFSEDLFVSVTH